MPIPDIDEACRRVLEAGGLQLAPADDPPGTFWLSGATFAIRELLKREGDRWSKERQAWRLPSAEALRRVASGVPAAGATAAAGLAVEASPPSAAFAGWGSKHYHGHRERLRQRFLDVAPDALADYELLELLLFFSVYRRDTKPLAKELIARFGGLGAALAADPARYAECVELAPARPEAGA